MGCIEVDVGSLIELVEMYPHLYDVKDKNYKNNVKKESSWEEISAALSIAIDDCKRLWKNLRDRFTKERRSLTMGPDGPTSDWPYYSKMLFYSQYCTPRRTIAPVRTRHVDRENIMGAHTRYRPIAPKQITEDTETSVATCWPGYNPVNSPESNWVTSETEELASTETTLRKNCKCEEGCETSRELPQSGLKRKLPPDCNSGTSNNETDDIKLIRPFINSIIPAANNVNDAFALYLASRLNEMPSEVARDKRKQIISVIEDL